MVLRNIYFYWNISLMDTSSLLKALEKLYLNNSFESQQAAAEWTAKIIALLKEIPNSDHHKDFESIAKYFSLNLSGDTQNNAFNRMKQLIKTAIEELKLQTNKEENINSKYFPADSSLNLQKAINKIVCSAVGQLWVCDAYMDKLIIEELTDTNAVEIRLLTKEPKQKNLFIERYLAAKKQLGTKKIEIRINTNLHDRYFIVDENDLWSLGTSYNEKAGGKATTLTKISDDKQKIIDDFKNCWDTAKILKVP